MQRHVRRLLVGLTAAIAVLSTAVDVRAQALPPERVFASKATGWSRTLDRVEDVLSRPGLALVELDEARSTARDVRDEAEEEAKRTRETARGLRGRLGRMEARPPEARPAEAKPAEPKPAAAPSPESEEVRVQLERLRLEVTNAEGAVKLAEDAIARAGQALDRIARLRGELVWAPLFRAGPSPLSPATWGKAGAEVGDAWRTLAASWRAYFAAAAPRDPARSAAGVVAFNTAFYGALALALVWLRRRVVRRDGIDAPSYRRRLGVAVLDIVSRVGLAVVAIRYATNMIDVHFGGANGEPTRPLVVFAGEAFRNVLLFLFVQGLAEASLTPRHPRWRIAPFSAESARLIAGRGLPLAAAVVALSILNAAIAPGEFAADHGRPNAEAILVSIGAIVVLLMAVPVLRADAWTSSTPGEDGGPALLGGGAWALGRAVIGLALAVVAAAALAGYAALADRVVDSIIATALLAFVVLVLRALASDLFAAAAAPASSAGRRLREAFGITASLPAHGRLLFLLAVDFALFCGVALTLPVLWGADTDDIVDRAVKLAAGVRIGERTISPL
ncbi:MAG: DUF3772 domain-containing protein, partial [Rhodospirillales bacterium]|nr:DUF3772 domain-containing protein [Rhodospirillales bacterium]